MRPSETGEETEQELISFPEGMVEFSNPLLFVMGRKRSKKEDVRNTLHVCIGGGEERPDYLGWHRLSGLQLPNTATLHYSSSSCGDPNLLHNYNFTTVMDGDVNMQNI